MSNGPASVIADVQIPGDPKSPVLIDLEVHALKVALVGRNEVSELEPAVWNNAGVYVLLGAIGSKGKTPVYVGKSGGGKQGVRSRVIHQAKKNPESDKEAAAFPWWRAALIIRDTTDGFNAAQIGYLEGRLAAELKALPSVTLRSGREDLDTSLGEAKRGALDEFVPSILAALKLAGIPLREQEPEGAEDDEKASSKIKRKRHKGTIADLISKGYLEVGDLLTSTNKGVSVEAAVASNGDLILDGVAYKNPSEAARVAHNLKNAPNGWTSWKLDGGKGKTISDLREQMNKSSS